MVGEGQPEKESALTYECIHIGRYPRIPIYTKNIFKYKGKGTKHITHHKIFFAQNELNSSHKILKLR